MNKTNMKALFNGSAHSIYGMSIIISIVSSEYTLLKYIDEGILTFSRIFDSILQKKHNITVIKFSLNMSPLIYLHQDR